MRQRRRVERGRSGTKRVVDAHSKRVSEQKRQRLLIWGAAILGVLLVALLTGGWILTSYLPARATVAVVDSQRVQARDLVAYTQLEAIFSGFYDPRQALNSYVRDLIVRNHADDFGVSVTAQDVDREIAELFDPQYDPDNPPSSLSAEARRTFENYLNLINMRERDFRTWVEGSLLQEKIAEHFEAQVPETAEQVYVHWIVTENAVAAQEAYDRIEAGEEFAAVAQDLNRDAFLADENGEVGWLPRGLWEELDRYLFGEEAVEEEVEEGEEGEEQEPRGVVLGEVVGPLSLSIGDMVLMVADGPSEQPLRDEVRNLLGGREFQAWMDDRTEALVTEFSLTNSHARWIIDQLT